MSETYVCPGCAAHDMAEDCYHSAQAWELAEAMRDGIERLHPAPTAQWTPIEGAWAFADDAEALIGVVGSGPYSVVFSHPTGALHDTIGLVNGRWLIGSTDDVCDYLGDITQLHDGTSTNTDAGPRCGECRLGLGTHVTEDPHCDHHTTTRPALAKEQEWAIDQKGDVRWVSSSKQEVEETLPNIIGGGVLVSRTVAYTAWLPATPPLNESEVEASDDKAQFCHAGTDGDCWWSECPQKVKYEIGCKLHDWENEEDR